MKQMVFGLKQAQPKSKQSLHSCQIYSFLRYYTWQPTCSYTFKNKYIFLNLCTCSKYLYCQKKKIFFLKRKKARREKGGEKKGGGEGGEREKKKRQQIFPECKEVDQSVLLGTKSWKVLFAHNRSGVLCHL